MTELEQFELDFNRRFRRKKQFNIIVSALIFILGLTAVIYKSVYEGGFLTCFREMTFCGTVFSSLISFSYAFLSLYEMKHQYEITSGWLYTLRLSACTAEFIILVVVLIGFLPFVPADPVVLRYDMMNMHLIIPILTLGSFIFNDSPVGRMTISEHIGSLSFLALYSIGQIICILFRLYPEEDIPYFFLDIRNQPVWFTCLAFVVIFGGGYWLGTLFAWLNSRGSWCWYHKKGLNGKNGKVQ